MTNEPAQEKPRKRSDPLRGVLEHLVVPVFEEWSYEDEEGREPVKIMRDEGHYVLRGLLGSAELVYVRPLAIDHERTILRISWVAGMFIGDIGFQYLAIGTLLDNSLFHVQVDVHMGLHGQMLIGCDLVVRRDDGPLVRQRIADLLRLAGELEWFYPLRMPSRLSWKDLRGLEIEWEDLPHGELDEFLDAAMEAPPCERTPLALLRIAQGTSRWKDVLRLLREHPEELPLEFLTPLKVLALKELAEWRTAVECAESWGIENGRYEGGPWLSPSYMQSLIESGQDIEALRLLGEPEDDEPGFYDWLRGLARHRAGDKAGAEAAFDRYFKSLPGDVIGGAMTEAVRGEGD